MGVVLDDGSHALLGVDISNVNGWVFDGSRARWSGIDFAIFKATQGLSFNDRLFRANRDSAHQYGVPLAAYHFMERGNGAQQAVHFVNYVNANGGFDQIGAVVDFELQSNNPPRGPSVTDALDFIAKFRSLEPHKPLIFYTGSWYINGYCAGSPAFSGLPLWWASYVTGGGDPAAIARHVTPSYFPKFGGWDNYALRQYTSAATIEGHTPADCSIYRGSVDNLKRLFGIASAVPPKPTPVPVDHHPFPQLHVDGHLGVATIGALQWWLKVRRDGIIGHGTVVALQKRIYAPVDGRWGTVTTHHLQHYLNNHFNTRLRVDGVLGPATISALQRALNKAAGY